MCIKCASTCQYFVRVQHFHMSTVSDEGFTSLVAYGGYEECGHYVGVWNVGVSGMSHPIIPVSGPEAVLFPLFIRATGAWRDKSSQC